MIDDAILKQINEKLEHITNTLAKTASIPGSQVSLQEDIDQIKADILVVKASLEEQNQTRPKQK